MENDSRVRLLRILQLLQDTDEQHPISTAQIEAALRERFGIETYRITIQKDIAALEAAGYDVVTIRTTQNKYYLASRTFELPELKLLIDAVESSKFITERKSRVLVEKLTALAGSHQAGELKRNISISDRIKPKNEQIYYIMDVINEAINQKRKISFLYFAFDGDKRRTVKNTFSARTRSHGTAIFITSSASRKSTARSRPSAWIAFIACRSCWTRRPCRARRTTRLRTSQRRPSTSSTRSTSASRSCATTA